MKNIIKILGVLSLAVILPLTTLSAQKGNGAWWQNTKSDRLFDATTIVSLNATIENVERVTPESGKGQGLHLTATTENMESISIHLGPTWFLDNQEIKFKKGDQIFITGSKVTYKNTPAIIAVEVEKGDMVLQLRDRNGFPTWNGCRKKGMNRMN